MTGSRVGRRYAAALFEMGRERGLVDRYVEELQVVVRVLDTQPMLRGLLENPRVPVARKEELARQSFPELSPEVRNLIRLLLRKRREGYLGAVLAELARMRDEAEGITSAEVRTAVPLPDETVDRIRRRLEQVLGRRLRLRVEVRPELIGGLVVQIGDRRLDASLRRRLQLLRERIASGAAG